MGRLSFPLPVEVAGVPDRRGRQRVWFPDAETVFEGLQCYEILDIRGRPRSGDWARYFPAFLRIFLADTYRWGNPVSVT